MTPKALLLLLVACGLLMVILGVLKGSRAARERQRRLDLTIKATRAGEKFIAAVEEVEETPAGNHKTLARLLLLDTNHPWQLQVPVYMLLLSAAAGAGVAWMLLRVFLDLPFEICAAVAAFAAVLGPRIVLAWKKARIDAAFLAGFPDAVDATVRMLRAGLPITSAIRTVGQECPAPTNAVFLRMANQMSIGLPLTSALQSASQLVRLRDFRFFCAAVILQQSSGGNLVSTLEELSQIMQKRRIMRAKARAATSEVRFTAYVLGALPFVVIAAMLWAAPDYLMPLFDDKRGHLILVAGMAGLTLAFFVMRAMLRSINSD
jgi:tight adherence protein B